MNEPRPYVNARRVEWAIPEGADFKIYRVCKTKYADLLGIGAAKDGGRWNAVGQRAVYTSLEIGTAAQEVFSHLRKNVKPEGYSLMTIRIDGKAVQFTKGVAVLRYASIEDAMSSGQGTTAGTCWPDCSPDCAVRDQSCLQRGSLS